MCVLESGGEGKMLLSGNCVKRGVAWWCLCSNKLALTVMYKLVLTRKPRIADTVFCHTVSPHD